MKLYEMSHMKLFPLLLSITCSLLLAQTGVQANIHQGWMTSGLQTDSDTGNMLILDPKWKVLIAQCWSESTRQAARGGWEQYGEGKRGKDTWTEPWKLGLRNET